MLRVVAVDVVAAVAARDSETGHRCRSLRRRGRHRRCCASGLKAKKAAAGVEIAALQPHRELIGQRFALADVDHAEAAEIAVFRAERAVDDGDVLNQLRAERLQRAEVALAVALRALILLHVVHQHFESAVDAAVIEIEAEAADLERFAAAFVLAGVDAGVELLQHLVVAREQRAIEDFGVAQVDGGLERLGGDHDALAFRRKFG